MRVLLLTTMAYTATLRATVAERAANMTLDHALKVVKPEVVALYQENTKETSTMRGGMTVKNLDRATEILNGMFTDTESQLDELEVETGRILDKNYYELSLAQSNIAAAQASLTDAISRLSDALAQQKQSQETVESVNVQLVQVSEECDEGISDLKHNLLMLRGDLNVTGNIVKMVKCEKTMLLQCMFHDDMGDGRAPRAYYTFDHPEATRQLATLQTKAAREAVQRTLARVYDGPSPILFQKRSKKKRHHKHSVEHLSTVHKVAMKIDAHNDPNQVATVGADATTTAGRSGANKQVAPATVPLNPKKQVQKCTIGRSKNCQKFLDQIMEMQGSIQDEVKSLEDELHHLEKGCEEQKESFEQQTTDAQRTLSEAQTGISHSSMEKTQYTETERLLGSQIEELTHFLRETEKEYSLKKKEFMEVMCGIKKIRTEMYKFQGQDLLPVDCEVADWTQNECTVSCGHGDRLEKREIISPPKNKGANCPALQKKTDCNVKQCPQDCIMGEWEGWSACSADCGGGVMTKNRAIIQEAMYGGEACGETQETEACNSENCDAHCELSDFQGWTPCSKACDTGFQRRDRSVLKAKRGKGKCPPPGMKKEELQRCNTQKCEEDVECESQIDLVLLLDSSGSMGEEGFERTKNFFAELVHRFKYSDHDAKIGAILFSGPGTWDAWYKCEDGLGTEEECGLKELMPLTEDGEALSAAIKEAPWIAATTNTAGALAKAQNMLEMGGRQEATSIVVVVTDGDPNFKWKTRAASKKLRRSARLIYVPLGEYINLTNLKKWASRPVRENVIPIHDMEDLESSAAMLISNFCPVVHSEMLEKSSTVTDAWTAEETGEPAHNETVTP